MQEYVEVKMEENKVEEKDKMEKNEGNQLTMF